MKGCDTFTMPKGLQAAGRIYPGKNVACRRVVVNYLSFGHRHCDVGIGLSSPVAMHRRRQPLCCRKQKNRPRVWQQGQCTRRSSRAAVLRWRLAVSLQYGLKPFVGWVFGFADGPLFCGLGFGERQKDV
jgi:hypothetical protein